MQAPLLRADARANRARLIEAARAIFRERGLDAEMREIAERAGVGIATLYRNFATREDLVEAMKAELLSQMSLILDTSLSSENPVEGLRRFLQDGFSMLEQYGDLMSILHRSAGRRHEDHTRLLSDLIERVAVFIGRGIRSGVFRDDLDPETAATHTLACFQPFLFRHFRETRSVEQLVDAHVALLLRGLLKVEDPV